MSTEGQRRAYYEAQSLREHATQTKYVQVQRALMAQAEEIEEELGAAYAWYVEAMFPLGPLPFGTWILPPMEPL
ncbi:MAG: hypothetical protein JO069_11850 [Verrucomicrobia bacterium]|nr:hypothetical protein [Verrucomicrobiota bacterium]